MWQVMKVGPLAIEGNPEIFFFDMWWYQKSEGYTPKRTLAAANHSGTWSQPCSLQNSKTKPYCFQISQSIKYVTGVQTTTMELAKLHSYFPSAMVSWHWAVASTMWL